MYSYIKGTASTVEKFCSDTRIIEKNDLFISLKSETADGITYIKEALEMKQWEL